MKDISSGRFYGRLYNKKEHYPWHGQIELTYRCNLNCIHCYCKGSEDKDRELSTEEWKRIFDQIQREGCLFLTFTGGEPLIRDDFLELYSYAKEKGFIITLFTSAQAFTDEIMDYLVKSPPYSIEITLNGITKHTYETITQVKGSYLEVMNTIELLAKRRLYLKLKTNCLKQNKHELAKIKAFTEQLLGKLPKSKYYFGYDPMVYPRLNADRSVCDFRLSPEELVQLRKQDPDIWREYQKNLHCDFPDLRRDRSFLYHCNAWMGQFFINPYGRLQFCQLSEKFSTDLKTTSFKQGFYNVFPKVLNEKFKTNSKCQNCSLRPICYHCPARAYLETGDEEAPVPYFCELAKAMAEQMQLASNRNMPQPTGSVK